MTNEPGSRWPGRLLAAVDGALFGWFLMLGHASLKSLSQVAEFTWGDRPDAMLPRLTWFTRAILPEEFWSLAAGAVGFSLGFGMISAHSHEPLASRLFRWAFIAVLTLVVGVSLPILARFKNLSGKPDEQLWDEALFVVLAASFVVFGIVRLRRRSSRRL